MGLKTESRRYLGSFPPLVEVSHSDLGAEAEVVSCDLRHPVPGEVLQEKEQMDARHQVTAVQYETRPGGSLPS